jgi:predicted regulator of Ras-like GTPase activity (Roadblock/LC7/MglB family)
MTPSERLTRLDREVEDLKQAFVDAAQQLGDAPEVDGSYEERWAQISARLRDLRADLQPSDYDKDQVAVLFATLFDIRDLVAEDQDLDTIDQLVLASERVRHVIRDALDEHVAGVSGDVGLVVGGLVALLPNTTRTTIAELLGVDRRTLARWGKQSGTPAPRLKTVARLVAILRHNWSEDGIVAWFHRPRRDLEGRAPLAVLAEDNFDEQALLSAARAGRSMYAS